MMTGQAIFLYHVNADIQTLHGLTPTVSDWADDAGWTLRTGGACHGLSPWLWWN